MRRGRAGGSGRGSRRPSSDGENEPAKDPHEAKAAAHAGSVDPMDSEVFELKLDGQDKPADKTDDEGDEEEEAPESTSAVRRRRGSSSSSSGRRARRGGSAANAGKDEERAQAEAEKRKIQTVLMVAIPLGVLFLIVIAVVAGGGESHPVEDEGPSEPTTTLVVKDVPAAVLAQVKKLLDDGSEEFRGAERAEGAAKIAKLEAAQRKLSEAEDVANTQRNKVAEANRGANFDQLDNYEQEVAKTRIMVRKALQEASGKGGE